MAVKGRNTPLYFLFAVITNNFIQSFGWHVYLSEVIIKGYSRLFKNFLNFFLSLHTKDYFIKDQKLWYINFSIKTMQWSEQLLTPSSFILIYLSDYWRYHDSLAQNLIYMAVVEMWRIEVPRHFRLAEFYDKIIAWTLFCSCVFWFWEKMMEKFGLWLYLTLASLDTLFFMLLLDLWRCNYGLFCWVWCVIRYPYF